MDPQRWRRIEDLYLAALSLSAAERNQFVDKEAGADGELAQAVRAMLDANTEDMLVTRTIVSGGPSLDLSSPITDSKASWAKVEWASSTGRSTLACTAQ